jgi:hypothetical protein
MKEKLIELNGQVDKSTSLSPFKQLTELDRKSSKDRKDSVTLFTQAAN